jgi:hypothetical protein
MALTIAGIPILIGAALGLRFNVLSVILTIGVALLGTVFIGIVHGDRIGSVVLTTVLVASAIQIGYFAAIVTHAAFTSIRVPDAESRRTLAYAGDQHSFS